MGESTAGAAATAVPGRRRDDGQGPDVGEAELRQLLAGLTAVRDGDFGIRLPEDADGLLGEIATVFNGMTDQLSLFTSEVTRVAREVGSEGRLGGQARVPGVSGTWKDLTDSVNAMAGNLTTQVRDIAQVATAVAKGDLSQKIDVAAQGEILELKNTVNTMVDQLSAFADEVTRVAREVGSEGRLGGQAQVPGVGGVWRDLTDSVNFMAGNLTAQVRNIAQVTTAVAKGDLSQKITVDARGEILALKNTINAMVDQLSAFADEVTRVAREVGTEGRLGGQADVEGISGTWKNLTESVNVMADNLTAQVRSIAQVTTAVAKGDLSQKINVGARGEIQELKETINTMVDQLSSFADEVTRVAREVGTEGNLGGQATVRGVSGTWKDLTDNVNVMASNLTGQVRSIAQVAAAVARGDLSQKITVEAKGEVAALADVINRMVDTLSAFADEVTRVAREVGTEGMLGGQARVPNVAGTWKDLTDNVNSMANNLTGQVRNIAQVTTAVANGDLTRKIDVDARGEILELKTTINTMVDQLSSFAAEVTRVAREVGSEGRLGGQAEVEGVSGTWKRLTENVNELAGNLTRQVRAIAEVTSAVAEGDLTRSITVEASGEVADLKDNINAMVRSLRETTRANQEQDWLKSNLARTSGMMQGHRDLTLVARLIMEELAPLVGAQYGGFYLAEETEAGPSLRMIGSYGRPEGGEGADAPRFSFGQSLVGQAASGRRTIAVDDLPAGSVTVPSGFGFIEPSHLVVLPIVVEDQVLGVIELASVHRFTPVQRDFLEQLRETIGVNVNTIIANARTDELLDESQRLTAELQARSEELQVGQEELRRSNAELEEKAALLARQNRDIETKNLEIEQARQELETRAQELALASKYKSEFLANMSHELRTPLNSLLILAQLLSQNPSGNLTGKQVEYAEIIHSAGSDLLQLINDILDLSKVEAGKMDISPEWVPLHRLLAYVESTFRPMTGQKGLGFDVVTEPGVPVALLTDDSRLRQVLRNLLSNAVKFTETGHVELSIEPVTGAELPPAVRRHGAALAFRVRNCRPPYGGTARRSPSGYGTPASASPSTSWRPSSARSSRRTAPPAASTAGPGSACRSAGRSRTCSAARSPRTAHRARAARSPSTCRWPGRTSTSRRHPPPRASPSSSPRTPIGGPHRPYPGSGASSSSNSSRAGCCRWSPRAPAPASRPSPARRRPTRSTSSARSARRRRRPCSPPRSATASSSTSTCPTRRCCGSSRRWAPTRRCAPCPSWRTTAGASAPRASGRSGSGSPAGRWTCCPASTSCGSGSRCTCRPSGPATSRRRCPRPGRRARPPRRRRDGTWIRCWPGGRPSSSTTTPATSTRSPACSNSRA